MRKRLFEIIEVGKDGDTASKVYDFFMLGTILVSMIPLLTHEQTIVLTLIDAITVVIFIIDYVLRLITADYKIKKGKTSYIRYPFTPMAIIDLLAILPSITVLNYGFRLLKIFRLFRTLKVFRMFKFFRYSKNMRRVINVFKKERDNLLAVCIVAGCYIIISAVVIFNAEPETFPDMFSAIYWATVSLTTVGYGDIYATSLVGKIITMISSIMGIAVVALPAGIITAGFMNELKEDREKEEKKTKK